MATRTHHGSCACGRVRFEVDFDLAEGTFKCNCTRCTKGRFWGASAAPGALRVVAGEDALTAYQSTMVLQRFCGHCGIRIFGTADIPGVGAITGFNVAALDDVTPEELAAAPVEYLDGRHDRFDRAPAFTAHL